MSLFKPLFCAGVPSFFLQLSILGIHVCGIISHNHVPCHVLLHLQNLTWDLKSIDWCFVEDFPFSKGLLQVHFVHFAAGKASYTAAVHGVPKHRSCWAQKTGGDSKNGVEVDPMARPKCSETQKKENHLFFFPVVFWKLNMGLFKCVRVNLVGR